MFKLKKANIFLFQECFESIDRCMDKEDEAYMYI